MCISSNIISICFVSLVYVGILLFGALDLVVLILMKMHFKNWKAQLQSNMGWSIVIKKRDLSMMFVVEDGSLFAQKCGPKNAVKNPRTR